MPTPAGSTIDLVVVSVTDDKVAGALAAIDEERIAGPILLMNGVRESRECPAADAVIAGIAYDDLS